VHLDRGRVGKVPQVLKNFSSNPLNVLKSGGWRIGKLLLQLKSTHHELSFELPY